MCVSLGHDDPQPPGGDRAVDEDRITGVLIQVKGNPLSFGLRIHRSGPFGNRRHFVDRFTEELFPRFRRLDRLRLRRFRGIQRLPAATGKEKEKCEARNHRRRQVYLRTKTRNRTESCVVHCSPRCEWMYRSEMEYANNCLELPVFHPDDADIVAGRHKEAL